MKLPLIVGALASLLVLAPTSEAQVGVPNPGALPPSPPPPPPFGNTPHPFNNSHPMQPWDRWHVPYGTTLGQFLVPARTVTVPMEIPQPGSLPSTIEPRLVVLPAYTVTETTKGYWVHPHWGVRPSPSGVYSWTWVAAYFQRK